MIILECGIKFAFTVQRPQYLTIKYSLTQHCNLVGCSRTRQLRNRIISFHWQPRLTDSTDSALSLWMKSLLLLLFSKMQTGALFTKTANNASDFAVFTLIRHGKLVGRRFVYIDSDIFVVLLVVGRLFVARENPLIAFTNSDHSSSNTIVLFEVYPQSSCSERNGASQKN